MRRRERGQAAVELLGALPLVLAVAIAAAQLLALAGGGDARAAARDALPGWSRGRARFSVDGGEVRVRLRPPTLVRALTGEFDVTGRAAVEP